MTGAKFPLGRLVATAAVNENEKYGDIAAALRRHSSGDWGDLDADDKAANEAALVHEGRLLSSYVLSSDNQVWVITEADRSVTTVLYPSDY
jgi:hypothetical protein